ncbi:hypothetical protein HYY72_01070 [Candidatus Woesearchaeota archaeon]|nr:hypothetical protein [Candidatus Woesearchaeota archaeon]
MRPKFNKSIFDDNPFIMVFFSKTVKAKMMTAATQKYTATSVRNSKGIPTTVMPITLSRTISDMHRLWQTWYEPKKLVTPETLPAADITFPLKDAVPLIIFTTFVKVVYKVLPNT